MKSGHYIYCADADDNPRLDLVSTGRSDEAAEVVLGRFLDILETDMQTHPERLQVLDKRFFEKAATLTKDTDAGDLDRPLDEDR